MRKRGKREKPNQLSLFRALERMKSTGGDTMANGGDSVNISAEHVETLATCEQVEDYIQLYPGNWLYNAGVVGLLQCFDEENYFIQKPEFKVYEFHNGGGVRINRSVFKLIKDKNYFREGSVTNLKGKNEMYRNFLHSGGTQDDLFGDFVKAFSESERVYSSQDCEFCAYGIYVREPQNEDQRKVRKFYDKIENLSMSHNSFLGPSISEFPNSAWSLTRTMKVCHLCTFIMIHHHIAFTKLGDGSQIFINAPSFELMYSLNNLVKKLYSGKQKSEEVRKILGLTLIEHSRRLWLNLGKWSQMNIEVVIRKYDKDRKRDIIDFYSPPYHIVRLLSDRDIAKLIHSAGDNKVFEYILNGEHEKILEGTYREIRKYLREKNRRQNNTSENSRDREEKIDISKLDKKLKLYIAIKERSHG